MAVMMAQKYASPLSQQSLNRYLSRYLKIETSHYPGHNVWCAQVIVY